MIAWEAFLGLAMMALDGALFEYMDDPHISELRDVLKCVVAHGANPTKSLCTLLVLLGRDLGTSILTACCEPTQSLFWNSMSFLVILHSYAPSQRQHFGELARSSNRISGKIIAQLQKDQPCSSRHL